MCIWRSKTASAMPRLLSLLCVVREWLDNTHSQWLNESPCSGAVDFIVLLCNPCSAPRHPSIDAQAGHQWLQDFLSDATHGLGLSLISLTSGSWVALPAAGVPSSALSAISKCGDLTNPPLPLRAVRPNSIECIFLTLMLPGQPVRL